MAYDNNSDSTTLIYQAAGVGATIDYSSLSLNPSIADTDQLVVIRKFTPSSEFKSTAAPNGFGGVYPDGQEWWDIWTLQSSSSSGSPMYTVNTSTKMITLSTTATDYYWTRTNADGTTSQVYLPVFDASTDEVIVMRKTYALDNFVNWMAGTRITSKNLNLNADQLLHLLQELVSNFRREDLVNPFVGAASGICPLDSSGFIPAANVGASSMAEALAAITFTTGDGLSGGGTLASDRTFAVDLDDTIANGLSIISNKLGMGLGTSLTKVGNLVDVNLSSDGGLINQGGIKADAFTTLDTVTTSTTKLVTSSVIKELKDDVDSLGTGVRFLGGITTAAQASATFTFGNTEFDDHADETITIIDTAGTSKTYKIKASGANASSQEFNDGADATEAATNFCALVNSSNGHNKTITATNVAGAVTLVQATGGTDGNRTIAHTSNWDAICDVNPPTAFTGGDNGSDPAVPAGGYQAGDTFDVITTGTTTSTWTDSSWDTLVALTQGHDVRYKGSAWESIPPVASVDLSAYLRKDGTTALTGDLNFSTTNSIINLKDAANDTTTELQNAATKNFVLNKAFALTKLSALNDVDAYSGTTVPADKSILVFDYAGDNSTKWKDKTLASIRFSDFLGISEASVTDGDIFVYDASDTTWKPSSIYGNPQVWSTRAGSITGGLSGAGDGSTVAFTLNTKPSSTSVNSFVVALDGVLQVPGQDFVSITAGDTNGTLTFATGAAPPYGSEITVYNTGKITNLPPSGYTSTGAADVPLTITGHASQSANLQEWKDSGGNVLSAITAAGKYLQSGAESLQILQIVTAPTATSQMSHSSGSGGAYHLSDFYYTGVELKITPKSTNSTLLFFGNVMVRTIKERDDDAYVNNGNRVGIYKNIDAAAEAGDTRANVYVGGQTESIMVPSSSDVIYILTEGHYEQGAYETRITNEHGLNFQVTADNHGAGVEERYALMAGVGTNNVQTGHVYTNITAQVDSEKFYWICIELG